MRILLIVPLIASLGACAAADVASLISPQAAEIIAKGEDQAAKRTADALRIYCTSASATPAKRAEFKAKVDAASAAKGPLANGNVPTMVAMDCDGDGAPDAI